MGSVSRSLGRIKDELSSFLPDETIVAACQRAGHHWRQRMLGPVRTIHLFILQVLNFNTAMTALRHVSKTPVQAPGHCRARIRLPLKVLEALLVQSSAAMRRACCSSDALWCGLRAYLVDGSSTITPDTLDSQKAFGQPAGCKSGCGFPVPKVLGLFDVFRGLIVQVLGLRLYTHEQSKVWMLHPLLGAGDLLVDDRGFCSFVHLAMLKASQRQHIQPHRISFVDTVRWLLCAEPGEPLPELLINPHRPNRHEPRVVKDREDTYTKMTRPRIQLCKELKIKPVAA